MEHLNLLTGRIIKSCIKIHSELGPGLFESVYEEVLSYLLNKGGLHVQRQVPIPVVYEKVKLEVGFRADMIVEHLVIVEIKSIETIAPVHKKQLLTYLKLSMLPIGLLINFNEELLKKGLTRIINTF